MAKARLRLRLRDAMRVVALSLLLEPTAACKASSRGIVGTFGHCSEVPGPAGAVFSWIKERHARARSSQDELEDGNATVFQTLNGLYIYDRCWTPRSVCELCLSDGSVLLLPHEPTERVLMPNRYVVLLGPAAAVGANSLVNAATLLEEKLGMPVVNLGRGGAGPHLFLGRSWLQLKTLLSMANAIVVITMSGRSSPNSRNPMLTGRMPKGEQNMRWIAKTYNSGERALADTMLRESVAAALDNTTTLLQLIRDAALAAGRSHPPRQLLLWFSRCKLAEARGCTAPRKDGQDHGRDWSRLPQLEFPHYIDPAFVTAVLQRTSATLVEADYGHLPVGEPMKIDRCDSSCPVVAPGLAGARKACTPDDARREMCGGILCGTPSQLDSPKWSRESDRMASGKGAARDATLCATRCATIAESSQTYPSAAAHRLAADKLFAALHVHSHTGARLEG